MSTRSGRSDSQPAVEELLDLSSRVALVTGAGRGIGATIASRLAEAGAAVGVHYRSSETGAVATADAIRASGGRAEPLQADLTNEEGVERLVRETTARLGGLNILVNNAGVYPLSWLTEMTESEWDQVVDANLKSVFLCTRAAARVMRESGGGAIVNVASVEGLSPAPMHSHYTAAKAGTLMHTRAAALELGSKGIRVNAVAPGLIWRPGLDEDWPEGVERWKQAAPLGTVGCPEDVANACLFLVSGAASWITGATLAVDGGILARSVF